MTNSKKFQMLLATIFGNLLVLVVCHFFPDISSDIVTWVIGGISSTGMGGVLGQSFADGMSRGLTSSNAIITRKMMDEVEEKKKTEGPIVPDDVREAPLR